MDRKLGIAVIGLHMGYGHFKQANEHPNARLVGVCDTNQAEVDRVLGEFPVPLATAPAGDSAANQSTQREKQWNATN